ncbi:MAG: putative phosphodiesterase [Cellvibrionaceae bacterium]|jgi:predicted phosphodiesterase
MKFAILSDIHANTQALETIADDIEKWGPDFTVVNGDIINRGPKPAECWQFVQEKVKSHHWKTTRGNHEEYVLNHLNPPEGQVFFPMSWWTLQQMGERVNELYALKEVWSHTIRNFGEIRATHASMAGSQKGIYPRDPAEKIREYIAPAPAVLCVGHVHIPYVKVVDQTMIVNSGSAGQPCYGEKKACYARVTLQNGAWEAEIMRLAYDRESTNQDWFQSRILEETAKTDLMTTLIYHEWRTAHPLMLKWYFEYFPAVKASKVQESVMLERFFRDHGLDSTNKSYPL